MTLIRDLISIPERVHQGDFVLKLSDGVRAAEETLGTYVVTPQLAQAFDSALAFIQSALATRQSKAAYLHGSFGSGKSHFMAVLHLLLAGNTRARSIKELAATVAKNNAWTEGKKFLQVPYHMIGARNMESAILGGYADHVRALHPEAPIPGFYLAEGLFRDAQQLRVRMGDEGFFGKLNEDNASGGSGGAGWGDLAGGWDANSFEAAMLESPRGDERTRLVGDLIGCYFTAYASVARSGGGGQGEAFVSLDDGLAILSRHASDLGYDGVILFLDELILWLASRAADVAFVSSEGAKLSKLVEAANADRPIPLISFVARQRDLRELVGDNMAGAMQMQFADVLKYWEARFHKITLEDRNLPVIAQARVLKPVSESARQVLDAAFEDFTNKSKVVTDTLLTSNADREMFRQVYPFSPALVQALVAVSSVLQRERTALKLMLQLLVDRRDDLELGQIIPVGDLWDVIVEGDEPFSDAMRLHFDNAKRLYIQKLVPLLERTHGVSWEDLRNNKADAARARSFRNDARTVETIVTDVLAPAAAMAPVLLLLVDGLSFPIFRELLEDARRQGWNEVTPIGREQAAIGLATIPSLTEISRTSLFCGQLMQGQAANEKTAFAQHPALMPLVPSNRLSAKPVLFHKGDLTSGNDGVGLSEVVRDAIGGRERKVVAVVFNGVDDHLSGSDQLNQRWTLDNLRLIKPLLYEARNAGRLVLITADHGHVIDEATHALAGGHSGTDKASTKGSEFAMGDRWRSYSQGDAGTPVSAEELMLSGGRVMAPNGQRQVVVPWSETLRYGSRKNGYHGGVSLQEMLVPITLLTTVSSAPEGFQYASAALPTWWELSVLAESARTSVGSQVPSKEPVRGTTKRVKTPTETASGQHALFEMPATEPAHIPQAKPAEADWIGELLMSSVFLSQKQWVARAGVKDEEIRALLESLSERGGKLSKAALAGRLSMPLMRVSGFVNSARRLLNVDQAPVITLDETEGSVSLNRVLLNTQFGNSQGGQK